MISPTRIAEITALAEAATPGEWRAFATNIRDNYAASAPIFGDGLWYILPVNDVQRTPIAAVDHADDHSPETRRQAESDAAFIAAARTAVPELLAEREAMVARVASATEAFESIKEFADSGENFLCWKVADDAIAALKEQS